MAYVYDVDFWAWTSTGTGSTPQAACESFGVGYAASAGGSSSVQAGTPPWSLNETVCVFQGVGYPILRTGDPDPELPPGEGGTSGDTLVQCGAACDVTLHHSVTLEPSEPPGGVMTSEMQMDAFYAVLGLLVAVFVGKRILQFFWRSGGDHA